MATKKVRNRPPQNNANAVEISAKSANVQMDVALIDIRLEQTSSHDSENNGHDEGESVAVTHSTNQSCEEAVKHRCPFGIL